MENLRGIQLGVLIARAEDLVDNICNNYFEESSAEIAQKEVLNKYIVAVENKKLRIYKLQFIYFLIANTHNITTNN